MTEGEERRGDGTEASSGHRTLSAEPVPAVVDRAVVSVLPDEAPTRQERRARHPLATRRFRTSDKDGSPPAPYGERYRARGTCRSRAVQLPAMGRRLAPVPRSRLLRPRGASLLGASAAVRRDDLMVFSLCLPVPWDLRARGLIAPSMERRDPKPPRPPQPPPRPEPRPAPPRPAPPDRRQGGRPPPGPINPGNPGRPKPGERK